MREGPDARGRARPAEPAAEQELLDSIAMGPLAVVLRPAALTEDGVGTLLADALGRQPSYATGARTAPRRRWPE